jgi:hypothetical protein
LFQCKGNGAWAIPLSNAAIEECLGLVMNTFIPLILRLYVLFLSYCFILLIAAVCNRVIVINQGQEAPTFGYKKSELAFQLKRVYTTDSKNGQIIDDSSKTKGLLELCHSKASIRKVINPTGWFEMVWDIE